MAAQRERIIFLANRIASLRSELQALETELDSLLPEGGVLRSKTNGIPENQGSKRVPGSLSDRIMKRMLSEPTRIYSADDLMEVANGQAVQAVRSTLLRLVRSKDIAKARRGRFKLRQQPAKQPEEAPA